MKKLSIDHARGLARQVAVGKERRYWEADDGDRLDGGSQ